MIDLDKLEELAKAATPGDWEARVAAPANGEHGEFWLVSKGDLNLALGVTIFDSTDIDSAENAAYIEAAQPKTVLSLIAEVRALRETNQKLHRRAQHTEAPRQQFKALLRQANNHWGDTLVHEFNRLLAAHTEIQAMFRELARVYEYPQDGMHMHSCMDSNVEFPREKHEGVWANCFLTRQGGMKSFRVLDEVRRAVDELIATRGVK